MSFNHENNTGSNVNVAVFDTGLGDSGRAHFADDQIAYRHDWTNEATVDDCENCHFCALKLFAIS